MLDSDVSSYILLLRVYRLTTFTTRFHAFTACTVILFSTAQKALHGMPFENCEDDLLKAQICLSVLEFCSRDDHVAEKFFGSLSSHYEVISTTIRSGGGVAKNEAVDDELPLVDNIEPSTTTEQYTQDNLPKDLFTVPPNGNPMLAHHSFALLAMLCRPFGELGSMFTPEWSINTGSWSDSSRYEHIQLVETNDWDWESSQTFQWNLHQTGANKFLGSSKPWGWLTLPVDMNFES